MVTGDTDLLRRLLGTPDTAWLLARLRARLEQHGELRGTVVKQQATQGERTAVARLLGRPVRAGNSASVPLAALDAALRRNAWPGGLESAVVALTGPFVHPDERRGQREEWRAASDRIHAIGAQHPNAAEWADAVVRGGSLKRAAADTADARRIAGQLGALADALPVEVEVVGVLAARLYGDAHALDARTPLGTLGAALAGALGGASAGGAAVASGGASAGTSVVTGAHVRREAWASVGVVVDELSSSVLALALPGGTNSPTAHALAALAEVGQPALLTYRQLAADVIGGVPSVVHVCENPAVVAAAADRFGPRSAALVCVGGQPGAAAVRLLRQMVDSGSELRFHGDFDTGGVAIARTLARHVPWLPWRFTGADYLDAIATLPDLVPFTGTVRETPWSPELAEALEEHRLRVEEESVIERLLADLA